MCFSQQLSFILLGSKQNDSPPTYTNPGLLQYIEENRNESMIDLSDRHLKNEDVEIIGYYLLQNNTVMTYLIPSTLRVI